MMIKKKAEYMIVHVIIPLTLQVILLLKEYLSSGDIQEATRCLQELEVPHFHHEVVYEVTVFISSLAFRPQGFFKNFFHKM